MVRRFSRTFDACAQGRIDSCVVIAAAGGIETCCVGSAIACTNRSSSRPKRGAAVSEG
jgi:hypothetical protein